MPLFPEKQNSSEVQYLFGKSLSYRTRQIIVVILITGGILVELLFSFFTGLFLVIIGVGLSLIKGYRPLPKIASNEDKWAQVTPNEYEKITSKAASALKWDEDYFDITNKRGGCFFAIIVILSIFFFMTAPGLFTSEVAFMVLANIVILIVPQWLSGTREYLRLDKLIVKINILKKVMDLLNSPSNVQVLPMLATKETAKGKKIPSDARLMLKLLNAPDWFMGAQVQISINNVQGTDYPYVYCVLIFKEAAKVFVKNSKVIDGLADGVGVSYKDRPIPTSSLIEKAAERIYANTSITVEKTNSEGVDVLVIRQHTSKTDGYFTSPVNVRDIVLYTLETAEKILKQ